MLSLSKAERRQHMYSRVAAATGVTSASNKKMSLPH